MRYDRDWRDAPVEFPRGNVLNAVPHILNPCGHYLLNMDFGQAANCVTVAATTIALFVDSYYYGIRSSR